MLELIKYTLPCKTVETNLLNRSSKKEISFIKAYSFLISDIRLNLQRTTYLRNRHQIYKTKRNSSCTSGFKVNNIVS